MLLNARKTPGLLQRGAVFGPGHSVPGCEFSAHPGTGRGNAPVCVGARSGAMLSEHLRGRRSYGKDGKQLNLPIHETTTDREKGIVDSPS